MHETVTPKVGRNAVTVAVIFLLSIAVVAVAVAFAVAKTGFVDVPVLSSFYRGPTVTRIVEPAPIDGQGLRTIVGERLYGSIARAESPYRFEVTEAEMTGALQSEIGEVIRGEAWEVEQLQIVIGPNGLECTVSLRKNGTRFEFQGIFEPVVVNGGLQFRAVSIHVGDYPVHPALGLRIAGAVFSRDFGTWVFRLGTVEFIGVELEEGVANLTAAIANSAP